MAPVEHHDLTATPSRLQRWLFAGAGVVCVGLGAVGVFVPGLPTTIFLIIASWLFARSCPWLEERLIRVPLFRPFLAHLQPGAGMPRRAVVTTLAVMWTAILLSAALLSAGSADPIILAAVVGAGIVGTVVVVRLGRRTTRSEQADPTEHSHDECSALSSQL